jgi:hypothetical protein
MMTKINLMSLLLAHAYFIKQLMNVIENIYIKTQ